MNCNHVAGYICTACLPSALAEDALRAETARLLSAIERWRHDKECRKAEKAIRGENTRLREELRAALEGK